MVNDICVMCWWKHTGISMCGESFDEFKQRIFCDGSEALCPSEITEGTPHINHFGNTGCDSVSVTNGPPGWCPYKVEHTIGAQKFDD